MQCDYIGVEFYVIGSGMAMSLFGRRGFLEVLVKNNYWIITGPQLTTHSISQPLQDRQSVSVWLISCAAITCVCFVLTIGSKFITIARKYPILEEIIRMAAYIVLFIVVPICIWERVFFGEPDDSVYFWVSFIVCMTIGGSLLALHVPEIWWPGKFDLAFHSHSLMHCVMSGAATSQFLAIKHDIDVHYNSVSHSDAMHYTWLASWLLQCTLAFMFSALIGFNLKFLLGRHSVESKAADNSSASRHNSSEAEYDSNKQHSKLE